MVPGWTEAVKPYQMEARFWYSVWLSYGKPLNCPIHNMMKHSRNQYHYAVRRIKKNASEIGSQKMMQSYLKDKRPGIIKNMKKLRTSGKVSSTVNIDNRSDPREIANHFSSIYKKLYNTHDSHNDMNDLLVDLNNDISQNSMNDVELVTPEVVFQAISSINSNKSDNNFDFKSDAFIKAKDIVTKHITLLLQSCLIHGFVPNTLLSCSLKPIIKDKLGDKSSSSNYRAIGISALILKIFDWVILILFGDKLKPSELQFGFQRKNSTTMCSWVVVETINFFNNRDTPVFACFLDLTKAFDLVNFSKLFHKLRFRISSIFVRLLSYIYMFQKCKVEWNMSCSDDFNVNNGVRQGAVLSPTLFSLYIDELFEILKKSGLGCFINQYYYGVVGYADDIVLLCPDRSGLQQMVNITHDFLSDMGLCISVNHIEPKKSKTKCVAFGTKYDPIPIVLTGSPLPWCDRYKHLGHMIFKNGTLDIDCDMKKRSFNGQFHALRQEVKQQDPFIFMELVNVYLCSFYGSNLWNLFNCDSLYVTWNNMIRNVFNLPFRTHRCLIEPVSCTPHLFTRLTNRFMKFYNSIYSSDKCVINNLRCVQQNDLRSTFGLNIHNMCPTTNDMTMTYCLD